MVLVVDTDGCGVVVYDGGVVLLKACDVLVLQVVLKKPLALIQNLSFQELRFPLFSQSVSLE